MSVFTEEQLAALEAAYEKATEGEWESFSDNEACAPYDHCVYLPRCENIMDLKEGDADFIALAHNLMPALIAEAREANALRADLARVTAVRDAAVKEATRLLNRLQLHSGDVMSLSNEIDLLQSNARDDFADGRKAGVEEAAKALESAHAIEWDYQDSQCVAGYMCAVDEWAAAIRALIDEEKGNGHG